MLKISLGQKETDLIKVNQKLDLVRKMVESSVSNTIPVSPTTNKGNSSNNGHTVERLVQSNQVLVRELEHKRKQLEKYMIKYQILKKQNQENRSTVKGLKRFMQEKEEKIKREENRRKLLQQINQFVEADKENQEITNRIM